VIAAHLPALQVVIPLIAAPVCVLLRRPLAAWLIATLVSLAGLFISVALLLQALDEGVVSYALGSWQPPWGIEYRIDAVNGFLLVLVSFIGALTTFYARASVDSEVPREQHYLFYAAYLLCLCGLLGISVTGDAFNIFVFLEISSLSTYILIATGRDRRALVASYQYLIMGTIGATFVVIGIGLAYLMTGTLNLADLALRLPAVVEKRPVVAALAFLTVGISLKLALFPLHLWLPNAYAYAPSVVTAFLAATATKVAVYLMLRFDFSVFGPAFVFGTRQLGEILLLLSLAAMFIASTVAVFQVNIKRMFAYSSLAQIGYITLGMSLASQTGLTAAVVHLFNHGITKGALFMLLGGVALRVGGVSITDLNGLGRRMPVTAFGLVVGGLSLIGIPLTVGFVSKWYLVLAAIERGIGWLAGAIVASSLLAVIYVWRLVEVMYFREPPPEAAKGEAPASMLIPAWILVAACVFFGVDADLTVNVARRAAQTLLGAAP
jgi:multicomponent Na+:H+ antiporter subunit D